MFIIAYSFQLWKKDPSTNFSRECFTFLVEIICRRSMSYCYTKNKSSSIRIMTERRHLLYCWYIAISVKVNLSFPMIYFERFRTKKMFYLTHLPSQRFENVLEWLPALKKSDKFFSLFAEPLGKFTFCYIFYYIIS